MGPPPARPWHDQRISRTGGRSYTAGSTGHTARSRDTGAGRWAARTGRPRTCHLRGRRPSPGIPPVGFLPPGPPGLDTTHLGSEFREPRHAKFPDCDVLDDRHTRLAADVGGYTIGQLQRGTGFPAYRPDGNRVSIQGEMA
ncbi:MAG: hypothetical protein MPJ22_00740 [Pirellulales bacterium]|nr:hypothetical protein [Pirellulales bacterium]MDA8040936.1 hypothetical protein [Pirellulales bacterium]